MRLQLAVVKVSLIILTRHSQLWSWLQSRCQVGVDSHFVMATTFFSLDSYYIREYERVICLVCGLWTMTWRFQSFMRIPLITKRYHLARARLQWYTVLQL